ncbi:MAG: hypothetical protein ABR600_03110 [Actinomycetota bacterium]
MGSPVSDRSSAATSATAIPRLSKRSLSGLRFSLFFLLGIVSWCSSATPAWAAPRASACRLDGTFRTIPSLKTAPVRMRYTIRGTASDCRWTDGAPTQNGTFTARGSGTASCEEGMTKGVARIRWDDHRTSTMRYTTTNRYNLIELDGVFVRGESRGYTAHALLAFVVDINEPAGCITEFGLNRATFHGSCERGNVEGAGSAHQQASPRSISRLHVGRVPVNEYDTSRRRDA